MPLAVMILGLPRSATTRMYNEVCKAFKQNRNAICLFEPTNHEVVDHIYRGIKHTHDVVGEVIYDYDKIPKHLFDMIYRNTLWHVEWSLSAKPNTMFCGSHIFGILKRVDALPQDVVIKDVHLWVYARELVGKYPNTKFVFTLPSWGRYARSMRKRFNIVPNVVDKAGVGKFYRFFRNGDYIKRESLDACLEEAKYVYDTYKGMIESLSNKPNVYIARYEDTLGNDEIRKAIDWCLRG